MTEIHVEKRIHPVYEELREMKTIRPIIGKYQYIYSTEKGKISLIVLPDYFHDGIDLWEIYVLEGKFFDDVERFGTKEEAVKRIKSLLK